MHLKCAFSNDFRKFRSFKGQERGGNGEREKAQRSSYASKFKKAMEKSENLESETLVLITDISIKMTFMIFYSWAPE